MGDGRWEMGEAETRNPLNDPIKEFAAFHQLHNQIEPRFFVVEGVELDDVGVVQLAWKRGETL